MRARRDHIPGTGRMVEVLEAGETRVLCIPDLAAVPWPQAALLRGIAPPDFGALAARCPGGTTDAEAGTITLNFNIFVIQTGGRTIVVDAGLGNGKARPDRPAWHMLDTPFLRILAHYGIRPGDVDMLVLTHFHADHMGWATLRQGDGWVRTFPNARYLAPAAELDALADAAAGADTAALLHGAYADSFLPVAGSGGWEPLAVPGTLAPGLTAEAVPGHVAGLCALRLDAGPGAPEVLFCSDAIHHQVQLADPAVVSKFCADPAQAVQTRMAMLAGAAERGTVIAAYHFPNPVFGRVFRRDGAFGFAPLIAMQIETNNEKQGEDG